MTNDNRRIPILPDQTAASGRLGASALRWSASCLLALLFLPRTAPAQPASMPLQELPLTSLEAFRPAAGNWSLAADAYADRYGDQALAGTPGTGVLINRPGPDGRDNLFTRWEHTDLALELDFMMPRGSNSGIYLQGRYEIQLFDSWGVRHPHFSDLGGVYQRWDPSRPEDERGYEGIPPRTNASRAPGLWQHLRIVFQAPRFDGAGRKTANARFVEVVLNGVPIHENVEVTGPTRAAAFDDEQPTGPLMIQGDHGPVAFRNIRYKAYGPDRIRLSEVEHRYYEGTFDGTEAAGLIPDLSTTYDGIYWNAGGPEDQFRVEYSGRMDLPATGDYAFQLFLDWIDGDPHFQDKSIGGGRLTIDDRVALRHDGAERGARGEIHLEAGTHPFTLTYYKNRPWQAPAMEFYVEGPGMPLSPLNAPGTLPESELVAPILVDPGAEPMLLRSMVRHGDRKVTHAISVGDPSGVHYAMDLERAALLYAWRGDFVDATPMWHSRGQDQLAVPQGSVLHLAGTPALAILDGEAAPWPEAYDAGSGFRFDGYALDEAGLPAFLYHLGGVSVEDRLGPTGEYEGLMRTLTLQAEQPPQGLWLRVARGRAVERLPDGAYAVDGKRFYIEFAETGGAQPRVRTQAGQQELLLPVRFNGAAAQLSYRLVW